MLVLAAALMSATMEIPVHLRVGDGPEFHLGTIEAELGEAGIDVRELLAEFLVGVAAVVRSTAAPQG
ncbi:hypothetical protein [Streptomyces sp. LS1784]|uniref:hypothetical protein n=1 Tax=Streptomyces sp. LS1784 TaxID=2851533 RepID=UPI001CD04010|nr:hypothetical protein [Streptomyces sp. LS1784]